MQLFLGSFEVLWKNAHCLYVISPEDTPWEGGTFKLKINFTDEYPNKAPVVKILSPMFHPNGNLLLFLLHC